MKSHALALVGNALTGTSAEEIRTDATTTRRRRSRGCGTARRPCATRPSASSSLGPTPWPGRTRIATSVNEASAS